MPTKRLTVDVEIATLEAQARALMDDRAANRLSAWQRLREFSPDGAGLSDGARAEQGLTLAQAQETIAREYGYGTWARLHEVVITGAARDLDLSYRERVADPTLGRAVDLMDQGDATRLRAHLEAHPGLVHQEVQFEGGNYFAHPTLLEFLPENPTRQGGVPDNLAEVARVVLEAGAAQNQEALDETLMLAASSSVLREAGQQRAIIALLCDHGADPASAMQAALGHEAWAAVEALLDQGAPLTLEVAAALGQGEGVTRLLPEASGAARQMALSLAANSGRAGVVAQVLAAGADPDQYNPVGGHSHCTPLHSAVWNGHFDVVRCLVEHGARLDMGDIHHGATPAGWAQYAGHSAISNYLEAAAQS